MYLPELKTDKRIGLISDSYGDFSALERAVTKLRQEGVDEILHLGGIFHEDHFDQDDMNILDYLMALKGENFLKAIGGSADKQLQHRFDQDHDGSIGPFSFSEFEWDRASFMYCLDTFMESPEKKYIFTHSSVRGNFKDICRIKDIFDVQEEFFSMFQYCDMNAADIFFRGYSDISGVFVRGDEGIIAYQPEPDQEVCLPKARPLLVTVAGLTRTVHPQYAIFDTAVDKIAYRRL